MGAIGYYYTEPGGCELVLTHGQARAYPWHVHTQHWTVGIVRSGSVELGSRAGAHRVAAGATFCVQPYAPHSLRVAAESSLLVLCLTAPDFSAGLPSGQIVPAHMRSLLHPDDVAVCAAALADSIQPLIPSAGGECPWIGGDSPLGGAIQACAQQMLEAPDAVLSLDQMAARAGYSRWYFLRAFQHATGMTPHAFQVLCRLRLARSMLRADAAAAEAAVSAGFADQSHMHKVFRHHHGLTPGAFKKCSIRLGR